MSHSKRNTTRPVFTSYERQLAKSNWTSTSARLNRDSFLPFGSCGLCMEIARDPVACQKGDMFCRECALSNILSQKKELKRIEKAKKEAAADEDELKELQDAKQLEKDVKQFELTQAGLSKSGDGKAAKRKFEPWNDTAGGEDAKKAKKDDGEKNELPSFWTPSLTPDAQNNAKLAKVNKNKAAAVCPNSADDSPHGFSMQKIFTVKFNEDTSAGKAARTCPSCRKTLSNSLAAIAATKCGHVLCQKCTNEFLIKPTKDNPGPEDMRLMCFVCDDLVALMPFGGDVKVLPVGLVTLKSEGTGFSAKGSSKVAKSSTMFQC